MERRDVVDYRFTNIPNSIIFQISYLVVVKSSKS